MLLIYLQGNFYNFSLQSNYENYENYTKNKKKDFCDLNIDDIKILKRDATYEKLINKLIDKKNLLFDDDQIRVMKNNNQYYHLDKENNIINISEKVYLDCKKKFDSNLNDNKKIISKEYQNTEYNKIIKKLDDDIIESSSYKGNKINVLENKNYLKNYYLDIFGNRVESNLDDYFANYYLTINDKYGEEPKEAIKVNVIDGNSNFIIPNQYNNNKHMTNAYNVDWSRIINPLTYY